MHFTNEIVWAGGLDDNGDPVTANGAVTDHRGVELEAAWTPRPRWGGRLGPGLGAEHLRRASSSTTGTGNPVDYAGNRIAGTPEWLAVARADRRRRVRSTAQLSVRHAGRFYLDNTEYGGADQRPLHSAADLALSSTPAGRATSSAPAGAVVDLRVNNLTDRALHYLRLRRGRRAVLDPCRDADALRRVQVDW